MHLFSHFNTAGISVSKLLKNHIKIFYSNSAISGRARKRVTNNMEALTKLIDESTTPGTSTYVAPTIVGTVIAPGGI
jgi:hypothetical protein